MEGEAGLGGQAKENGMEPAGLNDGRHNVGGRRVELNPVEYEKDIFDFPVSVSELEKCRFEEIRGGKGVTVCALLDGVERATETMDYHSLRSARAANPERQQQRWSPSIYPTPPPAVAHHVGRLPARNIGARRRATARRPLARAAHGRLQPRSV